MELNKNQKIIIISSIAVFFAGVTITGVVLYKKSKRTIDPLGIRNTIVKGQAPTSTGKPTGKDTPPACIRRLIVVPKSQCQGMTDKAIRSVEQKLNSGIIINQGMVLCEKCV